MNTVKVRNIEIGAGIPKICVPIVGVTREEILAAAENIKSTKADVVEWRVDWYEDIFDFTKTEATMQALREVIGEMPILFTFLTFTVFMILPSLNFLKHISTVSISNVINTGLNSNIILIFIQCF